MEVSLFSALQSAKIKLKAMMLMLVKQIRLAT